MADPLPDPAVEACQDTWERQAKAADAECKRLYSDMVEMDSRLSSAFGSLAKARADLEAAEARVAALEASWAQVGALFQTGGMSDPAFLLGMIEAEHQLCQSHNAALRANDWQSIETAPKDGTPVRLTWAHTTVEAVGRWCPADKWPQPYATDDWRDVKGDDVLLMPTHWCPVSAPPALAASEEKP